MTNQEEVENANKQATALMDQFHKFAGDMGMDKADEYIIGAVISYPAVKRAMDAMPFIHEKTMSDKEILMVLGVFITRYLAIQHDIVIELRKSDEKWISTN